MIKQPIKKYCEWIPDLTENQLAATSHILAYIKLIFLTGPICVS